jgi:branched-subunit amino acid transport protein
MTAATLTFLGLGLLTYLLKATGPLLLGGRRLPATLERLASMVPAPLLAALVLTSAVVASGRFVFDARLAGLAAAAVALRLRANFVVVVAVAAAATAAVRAVSG